jgi:hypothetical protein
MVSHGVVYDEMDGPDYKKTINNLAVMGRLYVRRRHVRHRDGDVKKERMSCPALRVSIYCFFSSGDMINAFEPLTLMNEYSARSAPSFLL